MEDGMLNSDITAVKLLKTYVLVGVGSNLVVFQYNTRVEVFKQRLLRCQKIHNIENCQKSKIIVCGGKQFVIVKLLESEGGKVSVKILKSLTFCSDWILNIKWIDDTKFAFLTGHNRLEIHSIQSVEPENVYENQNKSILYAGLINVLSDGGILTFAGTVFSEVILHSTHSVEPIKILKGHKGVIFSISCCLQKEIIITTSDDRSVRIWKIINSDNQPCNTLDYWIKCDIVSSYALYGHIARVLRTTISEKCIISVGEDGYMCFWDYKGNLLKKNMSHCTTCIWCVDSNSDYIVTGCGDGSVTLHPLYLETEYLKKRIFDSTDKNVHIKKIVYTARNNLVFLTENSFLIYTSSEGETKFKLHHKSTYELLDISECKQIIAVADMSGCLDIFIENCKGEANLVHMGDINLNRDTILSMHWLGSRKLVFCCKNGNIFIYGIEGLKVNVIAEYLLPVCKERYITAVGALGKHELYIFGDRNGNVHFYNKAKKDPIKSFKKVHGIYGPNCIVAKENFVKTFGRDGSIKIFEVNHSDNMIINFIQTISIPICWIERYIDKKEELICGFREKNFVLYDVLQHREIFEISCGGGHRCWDVCTHSQIKNDEQVVNIDFSFNKNGQIHQITTQLNKVKPLDIIEGFHSKEINCMEFIKTENGYMGISGSEDTNLIISHIFKINNYWCFKRETIFKNLSSVRTIKIVQQLGSETEEQFLVFSGGGRAQICAKLIKINNANSNPDIIAVDLKHYSIKEDMDRKNNYNSKSFDFDPETRIMCLDAHKLTNDLANREKILVLAGCSDSIVRLFTFQHNEYSCNISPFATLAFHQTCIIKTCTLPCNDNLLLLSMTTTGELAFWNPTQILKGHGENIPLLYLTRTNKAGINCFDKLNLTNEIVLIATGGDDNALYLTSYRICSELNSVSEISRWLSESWHCSQVTGVKFYENFVITASIDQRITIGQWDYLDNKISCKFLEQIYTDVCDVQGIQLLLEEESCTNTVSVCVYGKGYEILQIILPSSVTEECD